MRCSNRQTAASALGSLAVALASSTAWASESKTETKPDLAAIHRIKEEAFRSGKVMDHLFSITDANGPRLTGSPGFDSAADWAVKALRSWGLTGVHLEPWGKFGRAWTVKRFEFSLAEPRYQRLSGVPKAWSRGTNGPVTGGLVAAPLFPDREDRDDALDLQKLAARIRAYEDTWRGKLKDRFVLLDPLRDMNLPKEGDPMRYEEKKLGELGLAPEHDLPEPWTWPLERLPRDPKKRAALQAHLPFAALLDFSDRRRAVYAELWRFFTDEGALGILATDDRGEGSLVFTESTGEWDAARPMPPPYVSVVPEDYDELVRLAHRKIAAQVRLDADIQASDANVEARNVVAEIPGKHKRDELVVIGAHLDSWHGGTGATDNGAGSAVMLEVMRILETLKLPMERTVRLVLWSGEEEGLRGSQAYVKEHFADPMTMALHPEHAKMSVYLNLDNGSGRVRGVYLQENDMARPIFENWLSPFKDEGVSTLSIRNTGGTDHLSFDAVGLPGFQFIQDPLDYGTRTHHSTLDVYEHAEAGDLMQAAAVIASVVYQAANRTEAFPRKPVPPPLPQRASSVAPASPPESNR
jgi:carboxypeptidase Q